MILAAVPAARGIFVRIRRLKSCCVFLRPQKTAGGMSCPIFFWSPALILQKVSRRDGAQSQKKVCHFFCEAGSKARSLQAASGRFCPHRCTACQNKKPYFCASMIGAAKNGSRKKVRKRGERKSGSFLFRKPANSCQAPKCKRIVLRVRTECRHNKQTCKGNCFADLGEHKLWILTRGTVAGALRQRPCSQLNKDRNITLHCCFAKPTNQGVL